MQKLCVAVRHQGPDTGDDWDAHVFDTFNEVAELVGIKYGLRYRILRARFDLVLEPTDLFLDWCPCSRRRR